MFGHRNVPGVSVPPPPLLTLAPPSLSAVAWGSCFPVGLAESSSPCLQTQPPHLTLVLFYPSVRLLLLLFKHVLFTTSLGFSPPPPPYAFTITLHDFPLLFPLSSTSRFTFVMNALLYHLKNFLGGRALEVGEEDKLIKQTTTVLKCTDVLLCTAGLQPVEAWTCCLRCRGKKIGKGTSCMHRTDGLWKTIA